MNVKALNAQSVVQSLADGLSSEDCVEVCNAIISEAKMIKDIAEKEIEDREDSEDQDELD